MNEWHVIWFERTGRVGTLKVDNQPYVEGMASGAFTQLTLTLDLFIGGHKNFDEVAKAAHVTNSFQGCIQKVSTLDQSIQGCIQKVGTFDQSVAGMHLKGGHF